MATCQIYNTIVFVYQIFALIKSLINHLAIFPLHAITFSISQNVSPSLFHVGFAVLAADKIAL